MFQRRTQIRRQISVRDFLADGGNETDWIDTTAARALLEELKAEEATEKICNRQALRLVNKARQTKNPIPRAFTKLFTSSKLGLGISAATTRKRDSREQRSQFRKSLIKSYEAESSEGYLWCPVLKEWFDKQDLLAGHLFPFMHGQDIMDAKFRTSLIKSYDAESSEGFLWCPVLKEWFDKQDVSAGHLFPFMHGQDVMDAIFGVAESPELFSPLNGMLVSDRVGGFDEGFLVIVPRLPDDPTPAQISLWNSSNPKEYKMRIIDLDQARYKQRISRYIDKTWQDLD